jgi:ubiquinone/menaquinone biosynthesis C-methylase UbiE
VLTVRYELLGLQRGDTVLDLGTGFGRHAYEAAKRGAHVVALDYAEGELKEVRNTFAAMLDTREVTEDSLVGTVRGDGTRLPLTDAAVDRVIVSEVLEHIQDDVAAIHEIHRVLRPGGTLAVTVPSWLPEKINWMLSDDYHAPAVPGGHVRIYAATELKAKLRAAGFTVTAQHHAHALHSPYWWLRCATGKQADDHAVVQRYRRFLEREIMRPRPAVGLVDRVLNPLLGKSLVVYATARVAR